MSALVLALCAVGAALNGTALALGSASDLNAVALVASLALAGAVLAAERDA